VDHRSAQPRECRRRDVRQGRQLHLHLQGASVGRGTDRRHWPRPSA